MKGFIWTAIGVLIGGAIFMLFAAAAGCTAYVTRQPGDPVLITHQTETVDPAIRQHGTWQQVHGKLLLYPDEVVARPSTNPVIVPATQP